MSDALVMAQSGPFEVLTPCDVEPHNSFCEGMATRRSQGYNYCDACAFSVGLASLLWEKAQYESYRRIHSMDPLIRGALAGMGQKMAKKIGRSKLWTEYMENK